MNSEGLKLEIELLETKAQNASANRSISKQSGDILLVIHSRDIRSHFATFIESNYPRYTIRQADDAMEAYSKLERKLTDLIICEFSLPYVSGFDFIIKLKANSALKQIPTILVSSVPLHGIIDSSIPSLSSPFKYPDLKSVLNKILPTSRA